MAIRQGCHPLIERGPDCTTGDPITVRLKPDHKEFSDLIHRTVTFSIVPPCTYFTQVGFVAVQLVAATVEASPNSP